VDRDRVPSAGDEGTLTKENQLMPYADPERARTYFREYRRMRRGADAWPSLSPTVKRMILAALEASGPRR
jgi:hypothetical protein